MPQKPGGLICGRLMHSGQMGVVGAGRGRAAIAQSATSRSPTSLIPKGKKLAEFWQTCRVVTGQWRSLAANSWTIWGFEYFEGF